jgi:hypothetical protein
VDATLGAITAGLVARAAGDVVDDAVDKADAALGRLVSWLRGRFSEDRDKAGAVALASVEEIPGSPSRIAELARIIDQRAKGVEEFRIALESLVADVRPGEVRPISISQVGYGEKSPLIAGVSDSPIRISYSVPPSDR